MAPLRPQVGELLRRHGSAGLPRLDPLEDMDIRDPQLPEVRAGGCTCGLGGVCLDEMEDTDMRDAQLPEAGG